ncbi:cyclin-A3-2 [Lactuca sativa]|uniref:cyclin-A3-2 n=1 Tax=Lactuca sativa TaxID=4236 RepID=UPI000CC8EAC4|nr:cyclin-A3-2 [Lactuca sativa]
MDDTKQNSINVIHHDSRKRPFPIVTGANHHPVKPLPSTKRRVVLGDLTNSENLTSISIHSSDNKHNPRSVQCVNTEVSVSSRSTNTKKFSLASLIYQHLHSLEVEEKRRPLADYMEKVQSDITIGMREVLVDWLVEVTEEYKLASDTLFLTVSYIDRFLSSHSLSRNKLQLLGVSCMLVASKFEEISPPQAEDYCYITDNTYTKEEVFQMEETLLQFLNSDLSNPIPKTFLRILIRAAQGEMQPSSSSFEFLSWFLVELSLLDYSCLRFLPSMVAASAIFVARFTLEPEKHPWGLKMQCYSGYKPSELKDCVLAIHDLQLGRRAPSSRAVREKYTQHKLKCVAALACPLEIPDSYLEE